MNASMMIDFYSSIFELLLVIVTTAGVFVALKK